jgi:hypothetical protein
MDGANKGVSPSTIAASLNSGIESLDSSLLNAVQQVMPSGHYLVMLSRVAPRLVVPGDGSDYFTHEQVALWGVDALRNLPHHPGTEYYRLATSQHSNRRGLFEFLIPIFPHNRLEEARVSQYVANLKSGQVPTAISLSVLDVKAPADWQDEPAVTSHFCLAHYLIDGHHKVYASAMSSSSVTLLSFLAVDRGISSREQVEELVELMEKV